LAAAAKTEARQLGYTLSTNADPKSMTHRRSNAKQVAKAIVTGNQRSFTFLRIKVDLQKIYEAGKARMEGVVSDEAFSLPMTLLDTMPYEVTREKNREKYGIQAADLLTVNLTVQMQTASEELPATAATPPHTPRSDDQTAETSQSGQTARWRFYELRGEEQNKWKAMVTKNALKSKADAANKFSNVWSSDFQSVALAAMVLQKGQTLELLAQSVSQLFPNQDSGFSEGPVQIIRDCLRFGFNFLSLCHDQLIRRVNLLLPRFEVIETCCSSLPPLVFHASAAHSPLSPFWWSDAEMPTQLVQSKRVLKAVVVLEEAGVKDLWEKKQDQIREERLDELGVVERQIEVTEEDLSTLKDKASMLRKQLDMPLELEPAAKHRKFQSYDPEASQ
jgi:hypothetical protein